MIKKYKIIRTENFALELDNIIQYIIFHFKEPSIAKIKEQKINKQISTLDISPQRCPKVFKNNSNIRKLIFDNYIVIYEINEDTRSSYNFTYI